MKSYDEVKSILSDIEPTDAMYAKLNEEDIPIIKELLQEPEQWLASRAVFALSKFHTQPTFDILSGLVNDQRVSIRVSLASCADKLPPEVSLNILTRLIDDSETGVRKFAYQSIIPNTNQEFNEHVRSVFAREHDPYLKEILDKKISDLNIR